MTNDVSRFYLFLSGQNNWQTGMDKDGDGIIKKFEFIEYMENSFDWSGEESNQDDLINKFWNAIDTETSGKIKGTAVSNYNALSKNEISALEQKMEMYAIVDNFISKNITVPSNISNTTAWKNDVTAALSSHVEQWVWTNKEYTEAELSAELQKVLPLIQNKTTAEYCALEHIDQLVKQNADKLSEYYSGDDATLNSIINNYISGLETRMENETIDTNKISSEINAIVDSYFATAGLGESSVNLAQYGYSRDSKSSLNDLQKSVAKTKLQEFTNQSFDEVFSSVFENLAFASDDIKNSVKATLDGLLSEVMDKFINNLNVKDFANIDTKVKEFDLADYFTDDIKNVAYAEYYTAQANTLVDKIVNSFADGITEENAGSIQENLGIDLYNNGKYGEYKFNRDALSSIQKELKDSVESFVASFIASGADANEFEEQLKAYIQNLLTGGSKTSVEEAVEKVTADSWIADFELDGYKYTCISVVKGFINSSSNLQLGSEVLTEANFEELINAYEDGNQLMDDMTAMLKGIKTTGLLENYAENAAADMQVEQNNKIKDAASAFEGITDTIKSRYLSTIINGHETLHTEFGMDTNGNIVFQEASTTSAYNYIVFYVNNELQKTEEGKAAVETLGGFSGLQDLVQAAWIATYNSYDSSQSNNAAAFISKVLENLNNIMNKLETNPEYLETFMQRTSYADTGLTDNLIHYNTNTTLGGDQVIIYSGEPTVDTDGTVHIGNQDDDTDYQLTMTELLKRLKEKYSSIDESTVTSIFQQAQMQAIKACQNQSYDCPYGTGNNNSYVENGDNKDWGGEDRRINYDYTIFMKELVQLVLYHFDKLLYQELMA